MPRRADHSGTMGMDQRFPSVLLREYYACMSDQHATSGGRTLGLIMVAAAWLVLLGMLAMAFGHYLDRQQHPNRHAAGQVTEDGAREITLRANRSGHYVAEGRINGENVTFMLDTGATDISIPHTLAERLRLERGREVSYQTANGTITGFATSLDRVALGPIELHDVRGSINPNMSGDQILLGMSFLGALEFSHRDGRLTLRQHPP